MNDLGCFPILRLRRLRQHAKIRSLVREVRLDVDKLVLPLFIKHGSNIKNPIASMPSHYQLSLDQLSNEIDEILALGIKNILLFGIPEKKDAEGSSAYQDDGIIQSAIRIIKNKAPNLLIISDVCMCEYTDHGHCGVISKAHAAHEVCVDNDKTIDLLAKQAISHAKAGVDIIAPSASMDGMVVAIRRALDEAGYSALPILSYAVKYASSMYGPFRQAAEGAPKVGDRRTYQMDYANVYESLHECAEDIREGADLLMVKPAHTYLDIICRVKERYPELPLVAYHTSGEYAMLKSASAVGLLDEQQAVFEVMTAMHRAGADIIVTYYAKDIAKWLK